MQESLGLHRDGVAADDVGFVPGVAAVYNAAKFFVISDEGIGFIQEQGRVIFFHRPVNGGAGDIGGTQWLHRHPAYKGLVPGFPAPFVEGRDCQKRQGINQFGVGEQSQQTPENTRQI